MHRYAVAGLTSATAASSVLVLALAIHLVGYFLPHEGTNDEAWGLIEERTFTEVVDGTFGVAATR